ncbi:MAG: hypothetical protein R3E48_13685 [Burkholderiaceae bacterium]
MRVEAAGAHEEGLSAQAERASTGDDAGDGIELCRQTIGLGRPWEGGDRFQAGGIDHGRVQRGLRVERTGRDAGVRALDQVRSRRRDHVAVDLGRLARAEQPAVETANRGGAVAADLERNGLLAGQPDRHCPRPTRR